MRSQRIFHMYFVYLMQCKDGSIYNGITTDTKRRFLEHKNGKGGHYTRSKGAKKLLYTEKRKTKGDALKREFEIKSWRREKKLDLINSEQQNASAGRAEVI